MESSLPPDAVGRIPEITPPGPVPSEAATGAGTMSPDGLWRWDGARWQPNAPPEPPLTGYRGPGTLARLAVIGLVFVALGEIFSLLAEGGRLSVVNRAINHETVSITEATTSDDIVRASVYIALAVTLGSLVTFLVWLFRIVANNHALGARGLRFSPGWSVGWFFIPLANIVVPVQVVLESWRAADPTQPRSLPEGRAASPGSRLIVGWWIALMVGNLIYRISVASTNTDTLDGLHTATVAAITASSLLLLAAILGIAVVQRLTQRQLAQRAVLGEAVAA